MYKYYAYGLCVHSYMELAGYVTASPDSVPDVVIRTGHMENGSRESRREFHAPWQSDEYIFFWDWIGTFAVRGGSEIVIDPAPDADEARLQMALPGIIFGAVLHQRGLRVLHAGSVVVNGSAVAFMGHKYAGKSTMSAALHARGHRILTDDTLAVNFSAAGIAEVYPGIPRLHLWPDAVESLLGDASAVPSLYDGGVKRGVAVGTDFEVGAIPLRAIYVLEIGDEIQIAPLSAREALINLLPHTWAHRFLEDDPLAAAHMLGAFAPVARSVPVRRLIRPRSLEALPHVARAVEEDAMALDPDGLRTAALAQAS